MKFIFSVFGEIGFFEYPKETSGWLVWVGLLALIVWLLWSVKKYNTPRKNFSWELLILLLLAIPITGFLLALRLPVGSALSLPGIPLAPAGSIVLLLSALSWMLAGIYLGPLSAAILAALMGLIIGYYGNHSFFMPLVYALMGAIFSVTLRQRFRTLLFRLLRRPIIASLLLSVLYPILFLATSIFVINSSLPIRVDYILSHLGGDSLAFVIQLLLGGVIVEIISIRYPNNWFDEDALEPSPSESSLEARLFSLMAPLVLVLILILMAGDWVVAGKVSREMLETQMRLTADTAAENISVIQITGQSLLMQVGKNERLYLENDAEKLDLILKDSIRQVPFFDQLSLVDIDQQSVAGYPENDFEKLIPSQSERMGIDLASTDIAFQFYTLAPITTGMSARLSLIVPIKDDSGAISRVLIGRTSLDTNPYFASVTQNLNKMVEMGGQALLIDSQNQILFHTQSNQVGQAYDGDIWAEENFFYGTNSKGNRILEYFKPVEGQSWAVVTSVPAQVAQQAAMDIAIPLLAMLAVLILMAYFLLRYSLRNVTRSLQSLVAGSVRISEGDLEHTLVLKSADEVGQLGHSFEKMRKSLKSRLDEINRLLSVSQGVASGLEMESAVQPILEGALATGASSARLILTSAPLSKYQKTDLKHYGLGDRAKSYEALDDQILRLSEKQDEIILTDLTRSEIVHPEELSLPASLMAIALRNKSIHYGTLWVGYDKLHHFSKEEIRYLINVAGQAAMAAANARLYLNALLGRQRLEAILFSTPDPVLVTDHKDHLLLVNPAAQDLIGKSARLASGISIDKINAPKDLVDLLYLSKYESNSIEMTFENGRVYNAKASPILADGQVVGRVCVLRDVTYFKEDEALRSEFVSTVSHDLRTPLTLVQGFASMLDKVGDLNEEQNKFVGKIIAGVENMTAMVNNMLEIDRIEEEDGMQLEMVSATDIVNQSADVIRILAEHNNIKLSLDIPQEKIPMIKADKTLLNRALQNLIENAVHYTGSGGTIRVSLALQNNSVLFIVKDSGIGIAPVDQHRIFERFYRVDGFNTNKEKGSGLGLAIVRSIAEKHGGSVRVESKLGIGSTFYLSIPIRGKE